jgi:Protein of unknown function (DUF1573)
MKRVLKYFFILSAILTAILVNACQNRNTTHVGKSSDSIVSTDTAVISFKEYEHDFGKIAEGEKVASTFAFENKGKGPLMISSVNTSCGCTVPKYDSKPIAPGSNGIIEVVFDSSGKYGRQTKTITVKSNASKPIVLLRITGEVITSTNN